MDSQRIPTSVKLQALLGKIFYFPLMVWVLVGLIFTGLKVKNHKELRRFYKELTDEKYPPLIICPNHMTYIDSVILIYAFGSHLWYSLNYRRHTWNLVAAEYSKNPLFRYICYFSKCLFIDRGNERSEGYPTLKIAQELLKKGEVVLIFPEGRRTKTGRFDEGKLALGIGRMVAHLGECRVLCTYLRCPEIGEKSRSFPPLNSHYEVLTDLVHYKMDATGKATIVSVTKDVSSRIKALEAEYFKNRV